MNLVYKISMFDCIIIFTASCVIKNDNGFHVLLKAPFLFSGINSCNDLLVTYHYKLYLTVSALIHIRD